METTNNNVNKDLVANNTIAAKADYASPERCLEIMKALEKYPMTPFADEETFIIKPFKASEWKDEQWFYHCLRDPRNFMPESSAVQSHLVAKSSFSPELKAMISADCQNRKCEVKTHIIHLIPDKKYAMLHEEAVAAKADAMGIFYLSEIERNEVIQLSREELAGLFKHNLYCDATQVQYHIIRFSEPIKLYLDVLGYLDNPESFDYVKWIKEIDRTGHLEEIYNIGLKFYKDDCAHRDEVLGRKGLITHYINFISDEDYYRIMG